MTRRRRRPYTETGIRRLRCFRHAVCGNMAEYQWQICSDGNQWRPLCAHCDVQLNALVLHWMMHPEAESLIEKYAQDKGLEVRGYRTWEGGKVVVRGSGDADFVTHG